MAAYSFPRGVTSLGTLFAFADLTHAHTLDCKQVYTYLRTYLHMHLHRGTVTLKLHPRGKRSYFEPTDKISRFYLSITSAFLNETAVLVALLRTEIV